MELAGRRILVVEDESLVAMLLETILEDLGCETVGPVSSVAEALEVIAGDDRLDGGLLDVNVAGVEIFPVAAELEARGVPFVFSTGYGEGGLPDEWKGRITLQKPFTEVAVQQALHKAIAGSKT
jgi:CheY-like chemotaxis protein